jgi:hypothetical protein
MQMSARSDYSELVAQAEQAVGAVKDPELKRIAFQKVLDDLLRPATTPAPQAGAEPRAKRGSSRTAKRGSSGESKRVSKAGPQGRIDELAEESFFKKPKTIAQVKAELENRGHHIPMSSLSGPLQKLCQRKILRRQKITTGNKQTFAYSDW